MLQVFYLDVEYVFLWILKCLHVFFQVFQTHVSSVSYVFKYMLQIFYLDVSKTDRVSLLGDPPAAAGPGLDKASRGGVSGLRVGSGGAGDDVGPHVGV
jgi:hypothetical protein